MCTGRVARATRVGGAGGGARGVSALAHHYVGDAFFSEVIPRRVGSLRE